MRILSAFAAVTALAGCVAAPTPSPERHADGLNSLPDFYGGDEHWTISIRPDKNREHDVRLVWEDGARQHEFKLTYNVLPSEGPSSLILLSGEMPVNGRPLPVTVEIRREPCTLKTGRTYLHRVRVTVEGLSPGGSSMTGCGVMAVYLRN